MSRARSACRCAGWASSTSQDSPAERTRKERDMDELGLTQFVERVRFFNGQQLFASDLQSVEAFDRDMRWLHNRSLHQPGIGNGFAITGRRGDRLVTIGAGYASDVGG